MKKVSERDDVLKSKPRVKDSCAKNK